MDTLRDVELQLSRVVAVVQQRLLFCDSLHCQTNQSTGDVKQILDNIEKLHDNLKNSTKELAARLTPLSFSVENELKTQEIKETPDLDSETDTEDEFCQDHESSSDVGSKRMRENEGEEENEPETKRLFSGKERVAREKQLKISIKKYVQIVGRVDKLDETTEKKELKQKLGSLDRASLAATARLIKFIEDGGVPSMDIASSFRDITILLPNIISRNQEQKSATKKWTMMILKRLGRILDLGKSNPKLPAPFSDPQLEAARSALNDHKGVYCLDCIQRMEAFINTMKAQPRAFEADRIAVTLEKLASDYHRDFRLYARRQKSGKSPPRTEERWAHFARISEVLAQWIQRAQQTTPPPRMPGNLSKFDRQLRGFAEKYPDRVPSALLEESPTLTKLAQPRSQSKRPIKKEKKTSVAQAIVMADIV
ncbi:hypothetical protein F442_20201 [Phytophthora nicotianae P10297]|uniref:Uncharacterized protein n=1 Tax=Phytophthora nicotianae P10297 TaxID=1317064 RepID=W2Y7B5_PHYNI|nr:hypothetical protein F442_20201 [Phytophthora nicotianae P10297]